MYVCMYVHMCIYIYIYLWYMCASMLSACVYIRGKVHTQFNTVVASWIKVLVKCVCVCAFIHDDVYTYV